MYDIEQIKASNNLVTLAEIAGAKFRKTGGELRSACPIHHGHNPSGFCIFDHEQAWACYSGDCGGGDVIGFVMAWQNLTFPEACEWLGGDHKPDPEAMLQRAQKQEQERLTRDMQDRRELLKTRKILQDSGALDKYYTARAENPKIQEIWQAQGIPRFWQDYWMLGYCESFTAKNALGRIVTPTLAIPVFHHGRQLVNIRHRLLNPLDPNDKYRPEMEGLGTTPFFADPDIMYDCERLIFVEGEKKAMVLYLTLDTKNVQVIGLPGKGIWRNQVEKLLPNQKQRVYIWFDPDARRNAREFALLVQGRYVDIPMKLDDAIIENALDQAGIRFLLGNAQKPIGGKYD